MDIKKLHKRLLNSEINVTLNGYALISISAAYLLTLVVGIEQLVKLIKWLF